MANPLTQQGMAALKGGNRAEARRLFKQALQQDSKDVQAWLWLAAAVETDREKINCLQMVLRLDPNHEKARRGLEQLTRSAPAAPPAPVIHNPFTVQLTPDTTEPAEEKPVIKPLHAQREPAPVEVPRADAPILDPEPLDLREPPPSASSAAGNAQRKIQSLGFQPWMWAALGGSLLVLCLLFGGATALILNQPEPTLAAPVAVAPAAAQADGSATVTLTPSRTPLPSATITSTPTLKPTKTPTPTTTYMVLGGTIESQMSNIQQEVSDLRGLPIQSPVISYLVRHNEAKDLLTNLYINEEYLLELEDEKRSLVILGLVKPTYDLVGSTLNHIVDNIGGFYLHDTKQIYVLVTLRFGGIEHWVYSHEFGHALVDQTYNIAQMQTCPGDQQRCMAAKALIEGDATLLMGQWVEQYATPQDYRDFLAYRPPQLGLPEQFPPPSLIADVNFPYDQGDEFVRYVHQRGNWAEVNRVYANPPTTTEQILHPEKYYAGEGGISLQSPPLAAALGGDWQEIENNILGEWSTYLLLAFNADSAAQLDFNTATKASEGWGGDRYQVLYSPSLDTSALAVQWVWDSEQDGVEFDSALKKHLYERFRGSIKDHPGATCWEVNNQTSCVYTRPGRTLWLIAPDLPTLVMLWGQYPDFQ